MLELPISGVFLVVGGAISAAVLLLLVECLLAGLGCGIKLTSRGQQAGINAESAHPGSHNRTSGDTVSNVRKDTLREEVQNLSARDIGLLNVD